MRHEWTIYVGEELWQQNEFEAHCATLHAKPSENMQLAVVNGRIGS
jgi:hypothetical protein